MARRGESLRASASLLADEKDFARRRDLFARRAGVIGAVQDLRAERLGKLRDGARELGYENRLAMLRELRGLDYEGTASRARGVLSKTEGGYVNALANLLPREAGVSLMTRHRPIWDTCKSSRASTISFRAKECSASIESFSPRSDSTPKSNRTWPSTESRPGKHPAFCSPIRVPEEIKLSVNLTGGQANTVNYCAKPVARSFTPGLRATSIPNSVSAETRRLSKPGDCFENLALDERWPMTTFGFVENMEFRRALAASGWIRLRQRAALLDYEIEFHSGGPASGAGRGGAELMTDAARVPIRRNGAPALARRRVPFGGLSAGLGF